MADSTPRPRTLAARIDQLFQTVRREDGRRYTYEQVARALERQTGLVVSASYLWRLRSGKSDNPTLKHLEALATFFGVSPLYFFQDTEAPARQQDEQLENSLRDRHVREIVRELHGLSSSSVAAIAAMVRSARRIEGLPLVPPAPVPAADASSPAPSAQA